ncbi:MAG: hypothetical protein V1740_05290 [Candidatus Woesearchaeota archaeon]
MMDIMDIIDKLHSKIHNLPYENIRLMAIGAAGGITLTVLGAIALLQWTKPDYTLTMYLDHHSGGYHNRINSVPYGGGTGPLTIDHFLGGGYGLLGGDYWETDDFLRSLEAQGISPEDPLKRLELRVTKE